MSLREQYIDKFEITVPMTIILIVVVVSAIRGYLISNNIIDPITPQSDLERWGMTFDDSSNAAELGSDGLSPESKVNTSGNTTFEPLTAADTVVTETHNGYYTTTADGRVWSCGTMYNPDIYKGDELSGVPPARVPREVFNALDADGFIEGPFLVVKPDGTYQFPDIYAEMFHYLVSGNGVCITEEQAK